MPIAPAIIYGELPKYAFRAFRNTLDSLEIQGCNYRGYMVGDSESKENYNKAEPYKGLETWSVKIETGENEFWFCTCELLPKD
jgi:hypothetical protein